MRRRKSPTHTLIRLWPEVRNVNTAGLVLGKAAFSNHASGQPAHCADDSRANGLKRLLGMDQRGSQNPGGLGAGLLEERLWCKLPGREGPNHTGQ